MQTHGEEQLKIYTEAFVEFDFHPLKRYKRFTHSLFRDHPKLCVNLRCGVE